MSLDIKIGINKSYTLPINIDKTHKEIVNDMDSTEEDVFFSDHTDYTLLQTSQQGFVCNYVTGESLHNTSVKDKSVPNDEDWYYLIKTEGTYEYTHQKPYIYKELTYKDFVALENKDIREISLLDGSIRATRGMVYSKMTSPDAWMAYSFPFGGISKTTPQFYYVSNFKIKRLVEGENIKLDLLEGMVYINQKHPETIDQVFGYFDVEPIKISKNSFLTLKDNVKETYGTVKQQNTFGEVIVKSLTDNEYILTFSYDSYIVSSDPYFIEVDGVNLLFPRFIPKYTPILVTQAFNINKEAFEGQATNMFNGIESKESKQLTSFIKVNSESNIELHSEDNTSAGLFIYKESDEGSIDTTKASYIPLFNPQTILKEAQ